MAPDFLQVRQKPDAASSVAAMLQSVLAKTKDELEAERTKEARSQKEFQEIEGGLSREIQSKQAAMSDLKAQTSHSQEQSSEMQAQLLEVEELLKVTEAHLQELEADFAARAKAYKLRVAKRTDEVLAVREAGQILTSEAMQRVQHRQTIGSPDSFLQVSHEVRHRAMRLLCAATSPGLALLALRAQTSRAEADPFVKVKSLIRNMLQKLQESQSRDAEKQAWCDSELAKSTKSRHDKQGDVQRMKDHIAAMDAEIAQLANEIETVTKELVEMRKTVEEATALRQGDRDRALASLTEYRDAQKLLKLAVAALQRFYNDKAPDQGGEEAVGGYKESGMGAGVIGILEVALQDYAELEEQTAGQEEEAQRDFKALMDESEVRTAVFNKDLEYKSREKVRLEGERMRASGDLEGFSKELEAVETYLEKLQATCVGKADSYEERKARRDAELRSLQEALAFLSGQAVA